MFLIRKFVFIIFKLIAYLSVNILNFQTLFTHNFFYSVILYSLNKSLCVMLNISYKLNYSLNLQKVIVLIKLIFKYIEVVAFKIY